MGGLDANAVAAATVPERYRLLGLQLGRHVEGLVDAYSTISPRSRAMRPRISGGRC